MKSPVRGSRSVTRREALTTFGLVTLLVISASILTGPPATGAVLKVRIDVRNDLGFTRSAQYVTTGIPVPRGAAVYREDDLAMLDAAGGTVPCQVEVTARWGGGPSDEARPARWVLVTFPATVGASAVSSYYLVKKPNDTADAVSVTGDGSGGYEIDTGAARFEVGGSGGSLVRRAEVDGIVVTDSTENGLVMVETGGRVNESSSVTPRSVSLVENGPLAATVRVEGDMGSEVAARTDYTADLRFFAGTGRVYALLTVGNHDTLKLKPDWSGWYVYHYYDPGSVTFDSLGLRLHLADPGGVSYLAPGSTGMVQGTVSDFSVLQDSSGTDYWDRYGDTPYTIDQTTYENGDHPRPNSYQGFRGYRTTNDGAQLDSGDHFAGWTDLSDGSKGVTVALEDFWQTFPKGISAGSGGEIDLGLFPPDDNCHDGYNLRVGDEVTHRVWLDFHAGACDGQTPDAMLHPLRAELSPDWVRSTGALTEFTVPRETLEDRLGAYEAGALDDIATYDYYNDRTVKEDPTAPYWSTSPCMSLLEGAGHPASRDYFNVYGWAFYGNQPLEEESYADGRCAFFDAKYDFDFGAWLQCIRTNDPRWRELAESFSRHRPAMMLHDVELENGWDSSIYRDSVFGHSTHCERGCDNGVRNYNGNTPQFAWGARGSVLHYYLTGDRRSAEFARDIAGYVYRKWSVDSMPQGLYEGYEYGRDGVVRTAANTLSILVEGWRFTGDDSYRAMARDVMDLYDPDEQFYLEGPVEGSPYNVPIMFLGHYLCAMERFAAVAEEYGMEDEATLARGRLTEYARFMIEKTPYRYGGYLCSPARWNASGDNPTGDITPGPNDTRGWNVCNWNLVYSDVCAYAWAASGEQAFLDFGGEYFTTGVNSPYTYDTARKLFYTSTKEAANHAVHGGAFMYYSTAGVDPIPGPTPIQTPTPTRNPTPIRTRTRCRHLVPNPRRDRIQRPHP